MNALPDTQKPPARARDVRFVSVEPGRISLHGVALTDGEYAVLRGIAERMKQKQIASSAITSAEFSTIANGGDFVNSRL